MRKLLAIIILLCILYFIGGWLLVHFEQLPRETYLAYAGIVGGLASVVGLLAFTRPTLTTQDLKSVELQAFRNIAETTEQLQELESTRTKTAEEIETLELQRKEMRLLVQKASLALFLEDQYSRHEERIIEEVQNSPHLRKALDESNDLKIKLATLNKEIESDPNVQELYEIMDAARARTATMDEAIESLPPGSRTFFLFVRALVRALQNFTSAFK